MDYSYVPKALERLQVKGRSGEWWQCLCPVCPKEDSDGKLGVNFETQRVHCFRCGLSSSLKRFLREQLGYSGTEIDELVNPDIVVVRKKWKPRKLPFFSWTATFTPIEDDPRALIYLLKRGISEEDIKTFQLRYADSRPDDPRPWRRNLHHRVMVPTTENKRVVYFVGRDILGDQKPRYYNPPNLVSPKTASTALFNLEAGEQDFRVLVEGVFDAMRVGPRAIASFGKRLHFEQIRLLVKQGIRSICILPDNEGISSKELLAVVDALWGQEIEAELAVLPVRYKDAGETPRQVIEEFLARRVKVDRSVYFNLAAGRMPAMK
jgi:DNA primase